NSSTARPFLSEAGRRIARATSSGTSRTNAIKPAYPSASGKQAPGKSRFTGGANRTNGASWTFGAHAQDKWAVVAYRGGVMNASHEVRNVECGVRNQPNGPLTPNPPPRWGEGTPHSPPYPRRP